MRVRLVYLFIILLFGCISQGCTGKAFGYSDRYIERLAEDFNDPIPKVREDAALIAGDMWRDDPAANWKLGHEYGYSLHEGSVYVAATKSWAETNINFRASSWPLESWDYYRTFDIASFYGLKSEDGIDKAKRKIFSTDVREILEGVYLVYGTSGVYQPPGSKFVYLPELYPRLIDLLNHKEARVRFWAARLLQTSKPVKEALPVLIDHLDDDDLAVRVMVMSAIYTAYGAPQEALPVLVDMLGGEGRAEWERNMAAKALTYYGPRAEGLEQVLADAITRGPDDISLQAAIALRNLEPDNPVVIAAFSSFLRSEDDKIVQQTLNEIMAGGPYSIELFPELKTLLFDGQREHQVCALSCILKIDDVPGIENIMIYILRVGEPYSKRIVIERLRNYPMSEALINACIDALSDSSSDVRSLAADRLSYDDVFVERAVPRLLEMLGTESSFTTQYVILALGNNGRTQDVLDILLKRLKADGEPGKDGYMSQEDDLDACCIMRALGRMGDIALPSLKKMLANGSPYIKAIAGCAFSSNSSHDDSVAPFLIEALRTCDQRYVEHIFWALDSMPPSPAISMALVEAIERPDFPFARDAMVQLGDLGPNAENAIPMLDKYIDDPGHPLSAYAACTKFRLTKDPSLIPRLREFYFNAPEEDYTRFVVPSALEAAAPDVVEAIPLLVELLGDGKRQDLYSALPTLEKFGPAAREALPTLRDLYWSTTDLNRCRQIKEVIWKIEGGLN